MKPFSCYFIFAALISIFSSCSDELIKLYHPEELEVFECYWLLETVTYPNENPGFSARNGHTFTYTDDDLMKTIKSLNKKDSTIVVDYLNNKVSYSRIIRPNENMAYYDSLLIFLNADKRAKYALHHRYTEENRASKIMSINDSTTFVYDAAGYMKQLNRYSFAGNVASLTYSETYTVVNGNITEVSTSDDYRFIYSYDDKVHAAPSEYCYEMPRNTFNIGTDCWLMYNLPLFSDYMGTRSKNNVIHTEIRKINEKEDILYADIRYEYSFDENELVTKATMSGVMNNKSFENYVTTFSYIEKEKKIE
ncbi:MAG: hypothetical protein LBN74_03645 [Prevotella sp.]|jgi:hypothetical protein|nr:hypothetical protein [Prevotella sp.]